MTLAFSLAFLSEPDPDEMPNDKGEQTAASSSPAPGEGKVPNAAPADHATTPPGNLAGRGLDAQVNHLLNLEAAYKAVCEKREKIPFKWGPGCGERRGDGAEEIQ